MRKRHEAGVICRKSARAHFVSQEQTSINAQGKAIALRPGLTLTTEIITKRSSILNLILEPFRKLKGS